MTYQVYLNANNGAYSDRLFKFVSRKNGITTSKGDFETEDEALAFAEEVYRGDTNDSFNPETENITIGRTYDDGKWDDDYCIDFLPVN